MSFGVRGGMTAAARNELLADRTSEREDAVAVYLGAHRSESTRQLAEGLRRLGVDVSYRTLARRRAARRTAERGPAPRTHPRR
jgi:hypothetical protein